MATLASGTPTGTLAKAAQTQGAYQPLEMSLMGVGGKIAIPALFYLAVAEAVTLFFHPLFEITSNYGGVLIAGIVMIAAGFFGLAVWRFRFG